MNTLATMDRRSFLGTTAGGLTLGFALNGFGPIPEAQAAVSTARVNSWLSVGADNSITLTVGASEMGQGSFQGLPRGALGTEDVGSEVAGLTNHWVSTFQKGAYFLFDCKHLKFGLRAK